MTSFYDLLIVLSSLVMCYFVLYAPSSPLNLRRTNDTAAGTGIPVPPISTAGGAKVELEKYLRRLYPRDDDKVARFKDGAATLYATILAAVARNDIESASEFLAPDLLAALLKGIETHEGPAEPLSPGDVTVHLVRVRSCERDGSDIVVDVQFMADRTPTGLSGNQADGAEPTTPLTRSNDIWTFSHDTRSRDPNWTVIAMSENPMLLS